MPASDLAPLAIHPSSARPVAAGGEPLRHGGPPPLRADRGLFFRPIRRIVDLPQSGTRRRQVPLNHGRSAAALPALPTAHAADGHHSQARWPAGAADLFLPPVQRGGDASRRRSQGEAADAGLIPHPPGLDRLDLLDAVGRRHGDGFSYCARGPAAKRGAGTSATVQARLTAPPPPGPRQVCVPVSVPPVGVSVPL